MSYRQTRPAKPALAPEKAGGTFESLLERLREEVRRRLDNGEFTARGLARRTGISQPHVHNALHGVRILSPHFADRILLALGISCADLLAAAPAAAPDTPLVPRLDGFLGPGLPFPARMAGLIAVEPAAALAAALQPVWVALAPDPELDPRLRSACAVLLERDEEARMSIRPDLWYAVCLPDGGALRRIRAGGDGLETCANLDGNPWRPLPQDGRSPLDIVRGRLLEWRWR